jgi:ribosomal protein S6--L-glutamate ligase
MIKNKILILSSNEKLKANRQISEEIKKYGFDPMILDPLRLQLFLSSRNKWDLLYEYSKGKPERIITGKIKAVIPRIGRALSYGAFVLEQLNKNLRIYSPQNASALLTASDKMKTLQTCSSNGIRVPKTIFVKDKVNIDFVIAKLGLPFICKTLVGSQGKGVSVLDTKRSAVSVLDTLLKTKRSLLLQEFIGDGSDIRAIVVGNEVIAAQIRRSTDRNDFRSNLSISGKADKVSLDHFEKQFCVSACKAIGLNIGGVDFMYNNEGLPVLTEINGNFGWKIQSVTGINIASHIVQYVLTQTDIEQDNSNEDEFEVLKNSPYLHDAFNKTKGKKLRFVSRNGIKDSVIIKKKKDLYKIIEQTIIIE